MGDELGGDPDQDDNQEGEQQEAEDSEVAGRAGRRRRGRPDGGARTRGGRRGRRDLEGDAESEMSDDPGDFNEEDESTDPGEAKRPELPFTNQPPVSDYKVFTTKFDEVTRPEDVCDGAELDRLRALLDKQLVNFAGVARLANRLQRRLMAQQNRSWDFDIEEGILDTARITRVVTDPLAPLASQDGA